MNVEVKAIEKALNELWRDAAKAEHPATRAALWNLVVHASNAEQHAYAEEAIESFALDCPARIIVLRTDGGELTASVGAKLHPTAGGSRMVGSEEIALSAGGEATAHLPSLVRALALPDLPTALFWVGDMPDDPGELWRFLPGVDRLVVDSSTFTEERSLLHLDNLADASDVELADLGWLRIASARKLLASMFDPPIGALPLHTMTHLEIAAGRGIAGAKLLFGWLSLCLAWGEPKMRGKQSWKVPRPGGSLELSMDEHEIDAGADGLYHILIQSAGGREYSLTDAGPEKHFVKGTGLPARVLAAPEHHHSSLLVEALGAPDPMFRGALARAAVLEVGQ